MKHSYLKTPHSNLSFGNNYTIDQYKTIYNFPNPTFTSEIVIGVLSFGGGIYGDIDENGYLTNSDIHQLFTVVPTIIVKPIFDGVNLPDDSSSTIENIIDLEMIVGCCQTTSLTIILYIASQTVSFYDAFNYMLNTRVNNKLPSIISCSWGMPEIYVEDINTVNNLFKTASLRNINIFTATGDSGSSDGVVSFSNKNKNFCDFPSSSPHVIACGGTSLICPNLVYDNKTIENAWINGGGGISRYFKRSNYQLINNTNRSTPDLVMNADPNTGVIFLIHGENMVIGGTSIVAPAMAAYTACCQLNNKYIVPYLYKFPKSFRDIKNGNNGGFNAKIGFDMCSGLGSLNGIELYNNIKTGYLTGSTKFEIKKTSTIQYNGLLNVIAWNVSNKQISIINSTNNSCVIKGNTIGLVELIATLSNNNKIKIELTIFKTVQFELLIHHQFTLKGQWNIPKSNLIISKNNVITGLKEGKIKITSKFIDIILTIKKDKIPHLRSFQFKE